MGTRLWISKDAFAAGAHCARHVRFGAVVLLFAFVTSQGAPTVPAPISVVRSTIIAFFPPMSEADLKADPDANEALADFQFYASHVREPMRKAGIDFHALRVRSFRVGVGSQITTFRPNVKVGYYLIAPGKKPRVEYGVMSASDLMEIASAYFGVPIRSLLSG